MSKHHSTGDTRPSMPLQAAGRIYRTGAGLEFDLHQVRSVGLHNLCDVQSHTINRIAGSTSHVVHFIGGGLVRFAYNDQGQLLELEGHAVIARLDHSGSHLSFGPCGTP